MQDEPMNDTDTDQMIDTTATDGPSVDGDLEPTGGDAATAVAQMGITRMSLMELKLKSPSDLLALAEAMEIENANSMRKQDMMFAILKQLAAQEIDIIGEGVVEVLQDGFGFLRCTEFPGAGR